MTTYLNNCEKYCMIVSLNLLYCMFQSSYLKATKKKNLHDWGEMLSAYVNASFFLSVNVSPIFEIQELIIT